MYPEGFELPVTCAILGFGPKLSFVALPPKNLHYGEMIHFQDFGHHLGKESGSFLLLRGKEKMFVRF